MPAALDVDVEAPLPGHCSLMCGAIQGRTMDTLKPTELLEFVNADCKYCDRTYRIVDIRKPVAICVFLRLVFALYHEAGNMCH